MVGWSQLARSVCTARAAALARIIRRDADDRPIEDLGDPRREIAGDGMVTMTCR
jgi:hypothetical protein